MGYYIRVLGTQDRDISINDLQEALQKAGLTASLQLDPDETARQCTMINVENDHGQPLAQIERNPVVEGELGQEELDEFRELIREEQPQSAVQWLTGYFDRVKVIYAFQLLSGALEGNNYDIISTLRTAIWEKTGGILQADNEGFSNEEGYHILWQYAETVTGDLYAAVLNASGAWEKFRMDLGDHFQRMAFQGGSVPQMAVRL